MTARARGTCNDCGRRIVFIHVRLCDHCLDKRFEKENRT
jgi:hypothetical protein